MKKSLLILTLITISLNSFATGEMNIGLTMGGTGNYSKYSGGMTDASALFTNNIFASGWIGVEFRKMFSEHWSFKTGFNFSEFGFSYLLAKDYNLLKPEDQFIELRTGTCISQIPIMVIYQSKLNCKNWRFIAGGGVAFNVIDNKWISNSTETNEEEGVSQTNKAELTINASAQKTANGSFTWMFGFEKVFKRGNMLSFTWSGNQGFSTIATSKVDYKVDGKDYTHSFTNNGSWFGFGITYYFLPIGWKKMNKGNMIEGKF
jgi:hypothetical protein